MNFPNDQARRFWANDSGATVVEYGLIMALMTIALIGALSTTGEKTADKWDENADEIGTAMNG